MISFYSELSQFLYRDVLSSFQPKSRVSHHLSSDTSQLACIFTCILVNQRISLFGGEQGPDFEVRGNGMGQMPPNCNIRPHVLFCTSS